MTFLSLGSVMTFGLTGILAALLALPCHDTALATEVSWNELPDRSVQTFEDPYRDLSAEQLDALLTIVRARTELQGPDLAGNRRAGLEETLADAVGELEAAGIEPDWLISQRWVVAERRERAATAGNPDLDGSQATLSGFVIPAPPDAEGRFTAYLVPERGMCSHVPPPPPNQLLRLVFEEAWYPQFIYEPVKVSGRLEIDPSNRIMRVVDGPVKMASTFTIDVASVETLTSPKTAKPWPLRPSSADDGRQADRK
ncbi:DUF3299 domain-containing protein [Roseibium sp.]|uniref:DUF3299 domain-containing protein n=1 Tax=Roseibium sp. TaxID=1936156 RepID=UPI003BABA7C2